MRRHNPRLDAKPGETGREHVRRLARWWGPYQATAGLAEYVFGLQDRVDALERRVAEMESRQR